VVTDYFTKWPEARAAPTKEAFHVANFLFDLFLRHGCPDLQVHIPPVQQQSGLADCGVFAIAFALHTALGHRVPDLEFNQAKVRSHLLKCLTNRQLLPFPTLEKHSFRNNHFPYQEVEVFCNWLMPETCDMVQCDKREEWFHMNCVGLSTPPLNCETCMDAAIWSNTPCGLQDTYTKVAWTD